MGAGRRDHGGRGFCRSVGVGATSNLASDGRVRRQLSASFLHRRSRDLNPDNSAADARGFSSDASRSTGRPMPELFGVQELRKCCHCFSAFMTGALFRDCFHM